ncbi:hypothetical protein [Comamonas sp. Tr-654]|nr:hypothetical protein [Comamonas sp. Tr-654]
MTLHMRAQGQRLLGPAALQKYLEVLIGWSAFKKHQIDVHRFGVILL